MMSRKFTMRENILILIMAVLLLGIFYYEVVYKTTEQTISQYNTSDIESELEIEQAKNQSMNSMQNAIDNAGSSSLGLVVPYNNISNEIDVLNNILASADNYNLTFSDATLDGTTVRRAIGVSFHVSSYDAMKAIVQSLHDCAYRNLITDFSINASGDDAGVSSGTDLNVSLNVTFFETTVNSSSTAGLQDTAN